MAHVHNAARLIRDAPRSARELSAGAASDPGSQREVNEDRLYCDRRRGVFAVIDGVGGQAAGGRAADLALTAIKARLACETGAPVDRVREAITIANNEVFRAAMTRPEWRGMACVLTVVVLDEGRAIVGHVGDTRLYKLTRGGISKITHDHSPVGEREDARQISEIDAMQHPRRNEVYRDVGSELHDPADPDFIEAYEIPFEADAALLLCSDGLTDAITSATIRQTAARHAGEPSRVVETLIDAANAAGGKDNITVVYVEGEQFAAAATSRRPRLVRAAAWAVAVVSLLAAAALGVGRYRPEWIGLFRAYIRPVAALGGDVVVRPGASIAAALAGAAPGSTILVEPGEYHERLSLRSGVRLVSRVPRGATIRLPAGAPETDPAVLAEDIEDAEFAGFRVVGDAATALGTGVAVRHSNIALVDVEISGAARVAIEMSGASRPSLVASDVRDNPGAALAIRDGASPRIVHNVFIRNGLSTAAFETIAIDGTADPDFSGNVFHGLGRGSFGAMPEKARSVIVRDNWFPDADPGRSSAPRAPRGRANRP